MGKVSDILATKNGRTVSISPDTLILDALRVMSDNNVGAVLVMEGDRIAGILSERDYARKVVLKGRSSLDTQVSEIMTADVITVSPHDSIEECMNLMTDKHIRHLPVVLGESMVGVISIGDV